MGGRVRIGDLVKVRGVEGGPWPVLAVGDYIVANKIVHPEVAILGCGRDALKEVTICPLIPRVPVTAACVPAALCVSVDAERMAADELAERNRQAADKRQAVEAVAAALRSKGRARARWWKKHGPTVARLACGVGASLWAILGLVMAATR